MATRPVDVGVDNILITVRLAAGARPDRQAVHRPRRPHRGRVAHLPGRAAGLVGLRARLRTRAVGRRRPASSTRWRRRCSAQPKLIYVVPNFNNPTGATLSLERRRQLVEIAARAGVPIVEDDPYGQLRFEGEPLPSLLALAAGAGGRQHTAGRVIYLSSFSKILAPGLRLAWAVADPQVIAHAQRRPSKAPTCTPRRSAQMLAYEVAREGFLDQHIRRHPRAPTASGATRCWRPWSEHFPRAARWNRPQGGMFLWCALAAGADAAALLQAAVPRRWPSCPARRSTRWAAARTPCA